MDAPEFLICMSCETPCYTFEWQDGGVSEAQCLICGTDVPEEFITEEEFEAMTSGG